MTGFREELRAWLAEHFTPEVDNAVNHPDHDKAFAAHREWNRVLAAAGYAAIAWPARFGGRDAGIADQLAYNEEMARAGAPGPVNAIGVANIAPAVMAHGTDEQQERFLRPMLSGEEIWCQGMSEPEAGSDLAGLRCRAIRDGDDFVVNGQKTWNSNGDKADWCQLFVRTDPDAPKHKGITAFLVDMRTPGIDVRPIKTMAGDTSFSELFFTDVRVPAAAMLGGLNEGWGVATNTLSNERAGVATLYLGLRSRVDKLLGEAMPSADAVGRDALMARYIEVRNLEFLAKRSLAAAMSGRPPGPEGSVIKLAWSLAGQRLARTAVDVLGYGALDRGWGESVLHTCSLTIAGGTTEINKNILAERVLGLPRDPRPEPAAPFFGSLIRRSLIKEPKNGDGRVQRGRSP